MVHVARPVCWCTLVLGTVLVHLCRGAQHESLQSVVAEHPAARLQGVICTMVKDENRHLREWLAFHFMVGATKIVIYDDNQGLDGLAQVAAPFGKRVIIHNLAAMPDLPAELHPTKLVQVPGKPRKIWAYTPRQNWALRHCGQTYGGGTQQGWLAAIDVDEYIFPCDSGSPSVGHAFQSRMASSPPSTFALHLECLKFGFNDLGRQLLPGELRIQAHSRRAPYEQLEPHVEEMQWQKLDQCQPPSCLSAGRSKVIYSLAQAAWARPSIHVPTAPGSLAGVNRTWSRTSGVCCNHYMLRSSAQEMAEKFTKAGNLDCYSYYSDPHPRLWYRSVSDTLAMRFVPSLKLALQQPSAQAVEARPGG